MKVLEAIDTCNVAWLVEVSVAIVRGHYVDDMQALTLKVSWFAISMVSKMKKKANLATSEIFPEFPSYRKMPHEIFCRLCSWLWLGALSR